MDANDTNKRQMDRERTLYHLTTEEIERISLRANEDLKLTIAMFVDAEESYRQELLGEGLSVPRSRWDVLNERKPVYGPELPGWMWYRLQAGTDEDCPF